MLSSGSSFGDFYWMSGDKSKLDSKSNLDNAATSTSRHDFFRYDDSNNKSMNNTRYMNLKMVSAGL